MPMPSQKTFLSQFFFFWLVRLIGNQKTSSLGDTVGDKLDCFFWWDERGRKQNKTKVVVSTKWYSSS